MRRFQYSLRLLITVVVLAPVVVALWPWWLTDICQHLVLFLWTCAVILHSYFGVLAYRNSGELKSKAMQQLTWCVHGPAFVGTLVWAMTVAWLCGPELISHYDAARAELFEVMINLLVILASIPLAVCVLVSLVAVLASVVVRRSRSESQLVAYHTSVAMSLLLSLVASQLEVGILPRVG